MRLGSLFDGSGGFPLAGSRCGIEPVWAAEVEPYPIAVTRSRFPNMRHLGDISKVNGAEIEPVDIITFGSPCQDLSVAGKQAGIKHKQAGDEETTRSGLFMEAVRIIKEMREATDGKYPRFALWENVPGAFSSNKGEDFRIVCEELIKIIEPAAVMPGVPEKGWAYADSYGGDGWSLAYRVFDAQYWGVPQRRRRIHLVVDFRGFCAQSILFEREGVRGYFAEGRSPWQGIAGDAEDCPGADDRAGEGFDGYNGELTGEVSSTLGVNCGVSTGRNGVIQRGRQLDAVAYSFDSLASNSMKSSNPHSGCRAVEVSKTLDTTGPDPSKNQGGIAIVQQVVDRNILDDQGGQQISVRTDGKSPTLRAEMHGNLPAVLAPIAFDGANVTSPTNASNPQPGDPCHTLSTDSRNYVVVQDPVYCLQGNGIDRADTAGCNGKGVKEDISYTLNTIDRPAIAYGIDCRNLNESPELYFTLQAKPNGGQSLNFSHAVRHQYIVRRLTPTECARLQGFADRWGDIDKKDSFTDEECSFWLEVRNTHARINGRVEKDYNKAQMLTWYNKLHTDSAEYKMWGNGIALPPALYCMQGIVEAMTREEDEEDWML